MKTVLIINYAILNLNLKSQFGGIEHLKANIAGLKKKSKYVIVFCKIDWKPIQFNDNVLILNIFPSRASGKISEAIKSENFRFSYVSLLKNLTNSFLGFLIGFAAKFYKIIYYERANNFLNIRAYNLHDKILEVNDQFYPNDINWFNKVLCVSSNHLKSFKGKIFEGPWPCTYSLKLNNENKKNENSILVINSSPYPISKNIFKKINLIKGKEFNNVKIIGNIEDYNFKNSQINYSIQPLIKNKDQYFKVLSLYKYSFVSYDDSFSNERSLMGFPMKFVDLLSCGIIVYTDRKFDFVKKYNLQNWIRDYNSSYSNMNESDYVFLKEFLHNKINPENYFKEVIDL